jgi:CheY-like chemotaxis protein
MDDIERCARASGVDAHLTKPVKQSALFDAHREHLWRRESRRSRNARGKNPS